MNSTTLMQASSQWMNRPADERFQTLAELTASVKARRMRARAQDAETPLLRIEGDDNGTISVNGQHSRAIPSNWAFGQLSRTLGAPAGYLRTLPAPLAARCLMQGVQQTEKQAVKVLTLTPENPDDDTAPRILQAVTSPWPRASWSDQRDAAADMAGSDGAKLTDAALVDFARATLAILESHVEWNSDTTDAISQEAFARNLADSGNFASNFRALIK